jgi:hypothetical protein
VGLVQQVAAQQWSLVSGTPARHKTSLEVEGRRAGCGAWWTAHPKPLSPEELAGLKANERAIPGDREIAALLQRGGAG